MDLIESYLDTIHYKIGDKIFNLLKYKNHNNILIYGKTKCGKTTLIKSLIKTIIKSDYQEIKNENYSVKIYSNYYYFNCNTIYSKVYFINYIKEIIKSYDHFNDKIKYIVIDSYESISDNLQDCLKVIMEKSFSTTRFIIITNRLSKVNEAIKSRCMCIKIPIPTVFDKFCYLKNIKKDDINDFLFYEDCKKYNLSTLLINKKYHNNKIQEYSNKIIEFLQKEMNLELINEIKILSCEIKSINLPLNELLKNIINDLTNNAQYLTNNSYKIIRIISEYEHSLSFAYREIIFIESLIINLYKVINNI
jgi:replication factor C subunit 3/5|tara:strand:+ start:303 stop:1220 length:918 start_codon:yes stop_codon:yes gene_type:complete